tara:strand:- start:276 stop:1067 length:792 start_codon:yes stop_codon:yes gene_type:complete
MPLGLGSNLSRAISKPITPGIVTDSLVLKHQYNAGSVVPCSDGAAFFDGIDDYVVMSSNVFTSATTYTVGCWINYLTKDSYDWLFGTNATTKNFGINRSSTHIFYREEDGGYYSFGSNSNLPLNTWKHLVFASDSSKIDCYIDGALLGTITVDSTDSIDGSQDNNDHLESTKFTFKTFGAGYASGGSFNYHTNCYLANVFAYSSCLTQPQIKSIMNKNYAGLTDSEKTNLVSWWNLDVETNTSGESGTGGVKDHHGSNHGTLS